MKIEDMSIDQLFQKLKAINESVAMQVMHSIDGALADLLEHCEKEKPEPMGPEAIIQGLTAALAKVQFTVPERPQPAINVTVAPPSRRGFRMTPVRDNYQNVLHYDFTWLDEAPKP